MTASAMIGKSTDTRKSGIPGVTVLKPAVVFFHTPNNEEVLVLSVGSEGEHAGKAFKKDKDYHVSADLTGQANHLGVTIEADIIKQKLAENNGGYLALNNDGVTFGKYDKRMYSDLISDHPIDLCRYQVANCYMGRIGLINSGGASGENDFAEAAATAVINKRAGGTGLISGRKAFQRPTVDGVRLLNTIQDVYLDKSITVA